MLFLPISPRLTVLVSDGAAKQSAAEVTTDAGTSLQRAARHTASKNPVSADMVPVGVSRRMPVHDGFFYHSSYFSSPLV
jgi:hypothetical protein